MTIGGNHQAAGSVVSGESEPCMLERVCSSLFEFVKRKTRKDQKKKQSVREHLGMFA